MKGKESKVMVTFIHSIKCILKDRDPGILNEMLKILLPHTFF